MALDFENVIDSSSDLALWFKLNSNTPMMLSDIPEIIRLRWLYFRDNWELIKDGYTQAISTYANPELLRLHIDQFTDFVNSQRTSSASNPFDNNDILLRFFSIFDITPINGINLTYEEQNIVDDKINTVTAFTRGDFLFIRLELEKERDAIADKTNTTDEDYNRVFDRSPFSGKVNIQNKNLNKMYELQESIKSVDFVLANAFALTTSAIDPFALARQNANNKIDISSYSSGSMIKLNYNEDLQSLANRTLGSPDQWIDIAIANGLKPPYIDEQGEKINLISNASKNQINISGLDTNNELNVNKISVGQIVLLKSDVITFPEQRSILNITEVPISGELIIELDGGANLDKYKLADNAHLRVFKQNTINSSFFILIPSATVLDDDDSKTDTPWFLKTSDTTAKRQKVDVLLTDTGDLTFDPTGDLQLSYGLENSVQAVKLKMMIEEGELKRHPEYGLVALAGSTNNNIDDIKNQITQNIIAAITADERFARIDRLDVTYSNELDANKAVTLGITLVVQLSGSDQLIPITFSVNI